MTLPSLFIFAGEQSGDLHGSRLMQALKILNPAVSIFGVGGPAMRQEGMDLLLRMEEFEVMGFTDVILSLPKLRRLFYQIVKSIEQKSPTAVLLIDYPGFNLRLAKDLRKRGYRGKIIQYVSPSVWAHGKKRIKGMVDTLDLLLCILPFEPPYFDRTSLKAIYIGNPLQEYIRSHRYQEHWKTPLGIPDHVPFISLFPGSRPKEVKRNLPYMLQAVAKLKKDKDPFIFLISCSSPVTEKIANDITQTMPLNLGRDVFCVPKHYTYEMMRESQAAIAKSGTVTLELALHCCPTVVIYKLTLLNHFIAKWVIGLTLPYYALPNILANRRVFPELIQRRFSTEDLYAELKLLLYDEAKRTICLQGCHEISSLLKAENPSLTGARLIEELLLC